MSLHSNDSKREEYHRYLEKSGVIQYFSHVLVDLYLTPEKPLDPNEFIREQLSKFFPDDTDDLRKQILHHDEMLIERENTLHELQQEQYELRLSLEAKGVKVDELRLDDDDDGEEEEEEAPEGGEFGFEDGHIPVFKYHAGKPEDALLGARSESTPKVLATDGSSGALTGASPSTTTTSKPE